MSAASGDKEPQAFIARFLSKVQWKPWRTAAFAGALAYTKYGPLLRFVMKSISKKKGQPTDTSRDHECTDWAAVNKFAELFATEVTQAADGATDRDQELARILGDSGFPPSPEARP
jgi:menaquinone-dependent protoporphyrinogen oxidase